MYHLCIVVWISCIVIGSQAALAPFIKPCPLTDNACILESSRNALPHIVNGVPDLGVPTFNPLALKDVVADSGDLKLSFKNMLVYDLDKCNIVHISRDPEHSTFSLVIETPIRINGDYTAGGKLLFIDIEGDGPFEIVGQKMRVEVDFTLKAKEINGKPHYKITTFDFKYDPLERFTFHLENLFNGDKAKAEPIEKILNESWKDLILEIGKPVIKEAITKIAQGVGKLFKAIPNSELEIA